MSYGFVRMTGQVGKGITGKHTGYGRQSRRLQGADITAITDKINCNRGKGRLAEA